MIAVLIYLLIVLLIFGIIWWVIDLIPLPGNFKMIARAIVAIILLLILISYLLPVLHQPPLLR